MAEKKKSGMLNKAMDQVSKYKTLGIIVSILMIIVGICLLFLPGISQMVMTIMVVVTIIVVGVEKIFVFFKTEKGSRDGWSLALGIIWILLGILFLCQPFLSIANFTIIVGVTMGMVAMFNGISDLCNCNKAAEMGRSKGLMIFSGILGIICGIIMVCHPVISTIAIVIFYGAYVLVLGVSLLIKCLSIKKQNNK